MDKVKVIDILSFLSDIYRYFKFPKNTQDESEQMIENWAEFIEGHCYQDARQAVINWANEHPDMSPNAPQLMKEIEQIERRDRAIKTSQEYADMIKTQIEEDYTEDSVDQTEGDLHARMMNDDS